MTGSAAFPVRLFDGEQILWSGQPGQGVLLVARDWFLIPFSVLWCGFAVFWESMALRHGAPGFFAIWGVPFIALGLYFTVGRFALDRWLRRRTRYALTSRRILIVHSGTFGKTTSLSLDRLPDMQLTESAGGRGTIRFGPSLPYWGSNSWGAWSPSTDPTPQFICIDDSQDVFDRIQRAGRSAG